MDSDIVDLFFFLSFQCIIQFYSGILANIIIDNSRQVIKFRLLERIRSKDMLLKKLLPYTKITVIECELCGKGVCKKPSSKYNRVYNEAERNQMNFCIFKHV